MLQVVIVCVELNSNLIKFSTGLYVKHKLAKSAYADCVRCIEKNGYVIVNYAISQESQPDLKLLDKKSLLFMT